MESAEKARRAACLADEKKAEDILVLDVRGLCNFTDFFVVCTGRSSLQLRAIGDYIALELGKSGAKPFSVQGRGQENWMVLDFGDFVVHIMSEEARRYYALETLWGDARVLNTGTTDDSID